MAFVTPNFGAIFALYSRLLPLVGFSLQSGSECVLVWSAPATEIVVYGTAAAPQAFAQRPRASAFGVTFEAPSRHVVRMAHQIACELGLSIVAAPTVLMSPTGTCFSTLLLDPDHRKLEIVSYEDDFSPLNSGAAAPTV